MEKINNSSFTISLDFEMFWGVLDSQTINSYGANVIGVKKSIPRMIELFERYEINTTWALVSSILCEDYEEWIDLINRNNHLGSYNYFKKKDIIEKIKNNEKYFFNKGLVNLIRNSNNQEIASHTFSHFNNIKDEFLDDFIIDMNIDQLIRSQNNIDNKSFVFPRNQINENFLEHLKKIGFKYYRGNPKSFLYFTGDEVKYSYFGKLLRYLDTYIGFTNTYNYNKKYSDNNLVNIPATFYLRPIQNSHNSLLQKVKFKTIINKMNYCAKKNLNFHLWWHPHNFGVNLDQNIKFLKIILENFAFLKNKYNMQSKRMSDF